MKDKNLKLNLCKNNKRNTKLIVIQVMKVILSKAMNLNMPSTVKQILELGIMNQLKKLLLIIWDLLSQKSKDRRIKKMINNQNHKRLNLLTKLELKKYKVWKFPIQILRMKIQVMIWFQTKECWLEVVTILRIKKLRLTMKRLRVRSNQNNQNIVKEICILTLLKVFRKKNKKWGQQASRAIAW